DFLDKQFGRNDITWQNTLYYEYNFEEWLSQNKKLEDAAKRLNRINLQEEYGNTDGFQADKTNIIKNIKWLLGEEPVQIKPDEIDLSIPARYDWIESIIGRPEPKNGVAKYYGPYTSFGDHLPVRVYFPKNKQGKIEDKKYPVVLYLHEYAHSTGYSKGYNKHNGSPSNHRMFEEILSNGYAVVAFDMFGFGTRMEEAVNFYQRHPAWSKMGKMVSDVQSVLDGLEQIENVDTSRVFALGNTLGGTVGVYATALDERIKALVSVAGFSPYRTSTSQYESIRNMSHLHGLIPRLGLFAEEPQGVPVDFSEILACIAPRPMMVIAPTLDRYTDMSALKNSINASKNV